MVPRRQGPGGRCDETIHLWDIASGRHTADPTSFRKPSPLVVWASRGINSACWLDEETLVVGNDLRRVCLGPHVAARSYGPCMAIRRFTRVLFLTGGAAGGLSGPGLIRLRSLDDGRLLYTLLSLRGDFTGGVSPEGHWRRAGPGEGVRLRRPDRARPGNAYAGGVRQEVRMEERSVEGGADGGRKEAGCHRLPPVLR